MKQFTYSAKAFKRCYLPIFLILISPSLLIDGLISFRIFTLHPVILSASGYINLPWVMQLYLGNAVLLKGWAIIWLLIKRNNARKSWVIIKKGMIIFRRHLFYFSEWPADDPSSIEYHISQITTVFFDKKYIKIIGNIEKCWLNESNELIRSKPVKECRIPAWFQAFDDLYITLNAFMIRKLD